ncbi:nitroreductase family protein [Desulfovermiculus halophilus]|jgi:nitroreductase|uniref:nitroreductase family protein n=1 Tax=Desulfovermiculus halophilus TaxID=339722 RepID=UPI0004876534|nr:nitroreductase [Desulfovermiculus halophilus]
MENNPVLQAISERRSIRRFTPAPVSGDQIRSILEAGRWAPSGLNNQPWRFLVVRAGDPRQAALARHTKYGRIITDAQVLVVVVADTKVMYSATKDHQSVGACIQNMLLALHAQGLGGVWLGEILNQEEQVLQELDLSSGPYELMAVVALGHPAQEGASRRKPLSELLLEDFE